MEIIRLRAFVKQGVLRSPAQTQKVIMKKRILSLLGTVSAVSSLLGQPASTDAPSDSVISKSPHQATNTLGAPNLSFTNQTGSSFTVAELETQLANLNHIISETLPALSAFNTNSGAAGTAETLGGVLSKVLSKDRGENSGANTSQNSSPAAGSTVTSNLVGILRGILTTNQTSGVSVNANVAAQLRTLQQHLEASRSILDNLNLGNAAGDGLTYRTNSAGPLTPTGR